MPATDAALKVDPGSSPTNHVVYAGARFCDPALRPAAVACSLWDYNFTANMTLAFARFRRAATESIESGYFSPDGSSVFASYRDSNAGSQGLIVIARRAVLISNRNTIDDTQVARRIPMNSMHHRALRSARRATSPSRSTKTAR